MIDGSPALYVRLWIDDGIGGAILVLGMPYTFDNLIRIESIRDTWNNHQLTRHDQQLYRLEVVYHYSYYVRSYEDRV